MTTHAKLNIPASLWAQLEAEAVRLDRPVSWVAQRAWRIARDTMQQQPTVEPVTASDTKSRVNIYFDAETVGDLEAECVRLDRSASWLLIHAWRIARERVMSLPDAPDAPNEDRDDQEARDSQAPEAPTP